jgi:hypothetical protein
MCKRRRKRFFTCKPARRGLSEEMRELIAEQVWLEVTATRGPSFFRTIRERIAADREEELEKIEVYLELDEPYFGGYRQGKRGGEVRVILPPKCSERHLPGTILAILENTASCLSTASRASRATPNSV